MSETGMSNTTGRTQVERKVRRPEPRRAVKVSGAAEMLGVTPQTVRNLIRRGKLRALHTGVQQGFLVPLSSIDRLLEG